MPQPDTFRSFSVYIDGKLVGTAQSSQYDIDANDEAVIANGEYAGHTSGAIMTTLSIDTVEPVRPSESKKLVDAILNHKYLTLSESLIGGQVHTQVMRCKKASFTTDQKTGKMDGKFEFEGGKPEVVG